MMHEHCLQRELLLVLRADKGSGVECDMSRTPSLKRHVFPALDNDQLRVVAHS